MRKLFLLGFVLLMTCDTLAQVCFKLTATQAAPLEFSLAWLERIFLNPWVYGAILGYIGSFLIWVTLLKKISIGTSFAASHLEVVSVMLVSLWLFHEPVTFIKLLGSCLIVGGIILLAIDEEKPTCKPLDASQTQT